MGRYIFIGVLLLLSACGWRLRGTGLTADLPMLAVDGYEPAFVNELSLALQQQGVNVNDNGKWRVYVDQYQYGRRIGAVNQSGQTQSFLLTLTVKFHFIDRNNNATGQQQLSVSRDMQYDQSAVLSKDAEEKILRADLLREVSSLMIHRLRAQLQTQKP